MKKAVTLLVLVFIFFTASSQRNKIDSLKAVLNKAAIDTIKYETLHQLGILYALSHPDSSIAFEQPALLLAQKNNWVNNQARSLNNMASFYTLIGDYANSLQCYFKAVQSYERVGNTIGIIKINLNIGLTYSDKGENQQALSYFKQALKKLQQYAPPRELDDKYRQLKVSVLSTTGLTYLFLHKLDSAEYYTMAAYQYALTIKNYNKMGEILIGLGDLESTKGNRKEALKYYYKAIFAYKTFDDERGEGQALMAIGDVYRIYKQRDSAIYYTQKALDIAIVGHFQQNALYAADSLSRYYAGAHNIPQAFKYFKLATTLKDSIYSQEKVKRFLTIGFNEKQRQQELEAAKVQAQNKLRTYILSGGLGVLLLLAVIFWFNGKQRQKANKLLRKQKTEIEMAMSQLKLTQNQLIQSAKMASLGELTAGIAHEIQNPLNFVNNFSEVNKELLIEMKEEIDKGDLEEIRSIANDLIENEEKINHHGKRADFIVKGMLQHSRTSTGERQLTNINTLAEEFFKLSYQGLRAKDKAFNSEMVIYLDPNLPKPNVVQQDIGRVLLNLFNNAFYAVNQKAKTAGDDYKPEVILTTLSENGSLLIKVKDNGVGIPDAIKEKILQPFFTTKPTGEGTGLGLSLSYDILVKGHNGALDINSKEGEGSEFIVKLPLN